jgi:hypothetical protein
MSLKQFDQLIGELRRTLAGLSDNHVRDMLDPVEPNALYPVYDRV